VSTRAARMRRNQQIFRIVVLTLVGAFMLIPLIASYKFSVRTAGLIGGKWDGWKAILEDDTIRGGLKVSLELAVLTVLGMLVLLLPTMIWTRVKVPWARRVLEFVCLLPLTIPAIVLVVGLADVQRWVNYYIAEGPMSLTFPYIVLVLPYCYRALDTGLSSIDVVTLSEAARSLGAKWTTVILRVIMPNITSAVLSASFLAVALVLGEFTFAQIFSYENLQFAILESSQTNARASVAASVATLLFGFILLFGLSFVGRRRRKAIT
jgi:putative spermidine/putrescine transport system permease protein